MAQKDSKHSNTIQYQNMEQDYLILYPVLLEIKCACNTFKVMLDRHLRGIPNEPKISGYQLATESNRIIGQIKYIKRSINTIVAQPWGNTPKE